MSKANKYFDNYPICVHSNKIETIRAITSPYSYIEDAQDAINIVQVQFKIGNNIHSDAIDQNLIESNSCDDNRVKSVTVSNFCNVCQYYKNNMSTQAAKEIKVLRALLNNPDALEQYSIDANFFQYYIYNVDYDSNNTYQIFLTREFYKIISNNDKYDTTINILSCLYKGEGIYNTASNLVRQICKSGKINIKEILNIIDEHSIMQEKSFNQMTILDDIMSPTSALDEGKFKKVKKSLTTSEIMNQKSDPQHHELLKEKTNEVLDKVAGLTKTLSNSPHEKVTTQEVEEFVETNVIDAPEFTANTVVKPIENEQQVDSPVIITEDDKSFKVIVTEEKKEQKKAVYEATEKMTDTFKAKNWNAFKVTTKREYDQVEMGAIAACEAFFTKLDNAYEIIILRSKKIPSKYILEIDNPNTAYTIDLLLSDRALRKYLSDLEDFKDIETLDFKNMHDLSVFDNIHESKGEIFESINKDILMDLSKAKKDEYKSKLHIKITKLFYTQKESNLTIENIDRKIPMEKVINKLYERSFFKTGEVRYCGSNEGTIHLYINSPYYYEVEGMIEGIIDRLHDTYEVIKKTRIKYNGNNFNR
ncbi:MAG: hypothetical protein JEZ08_22535 [Clostridiales bacterium]|nr:hypothetical protein [Clostridiales bacterium]